jgi:hypothetical protein
MKTHFDLEWSLSGSPVLPDEPLVIWLDIETRKTAAPCGWPQRLRWQTFMIGIAGAMDPGVFFAEVRSGTEAELVDWISEFENYEIRYCATREFDEMVLRGRFTNARRAHHHRAGGWPNLDTAKMTWKNIRKQMRSCRWARPFDIKGRDVPNEWDHPEGDTKLVAIHCLRDVLENVLLDSEVVLSPRLSRSLINRITK